MTTKILAMVVVMLAANITYAKVSDFNAMINENLGQQTSLEANIKKQTGSEPYAVVESKSNTKTTVEVANEITAYNPSTPANMLTFKKERSSFRASNQKQQERLAEEFKSMDAQF